jgi:DNA-binding winged helix-turn-helix (wHTH) protein
VAIGPYRLDRLGHCLTTEYGVVKLSPLASDFLAILAERPGEVVDRNSFIDALWRGDYLVGDPALNRLVSEVRSAIGDDPRRPRLIQTVPRRGYRLAVATPASATVAPKPMTLGVRLLIAYAVLVAGACAVLLSAMAARHFR